MNQKIRYLIMIAFVLSALIFAACGTNRLLPTATHSSPRPRVTQRNTQTGTGTPTSTHISKATVLEKTTSVPQDDLVRILFVGNSLTFYNDLPGVFADLARSGGQDVEIGMVAPGGWSLSDHAASAATLDTLERQRWDYVVLQERSDIPAIADQRKKQMYLALQNLTGKIRETGGQIILFMTWGHRAGLPVAGLEDHAAMQSQIQTGCAEIARDLNLLVAPVGLAWQEAVTQKQDLDLWAYDGIHPNESGTYLAACVFYAVIFQQSPEGLANTAHLPEDKARYLQTIAAQTVRDELTR